MPERQHLSNDARMAMISQFLGFMLDAYDMALVLVMAPILVKVFISPKGSAAWQYIVIVFTYSITMASRPIGSALFGRFADKIGRRFLLVLTIGGVGLMSCLVLCHLLFSPIIDGDLLRWRICRGSHLRH
jgi:MFS family permease